MGFFFFFFLIRCDFIHKTGKDGHPDLQIEAKDLGRLSLLKKKDSRELRDSFTVALQSFLTQRKQQTENKCLRHITLLMTLLMVHSGERLSEVSRSKQLLASPSRIIGFQS